MAFHTPLMDLVNIYSQGLNDTIIQARTERVKLEDGSKSLYTV